jgi:PPOX class probable F420-dependent enzyme
MTPRRAQTATGFFDPLATSKYCSLTTYKRDGTPVATPVNVVVDGDVAYFRTWNTSGKAKRLRHTARVELRPSGPRGKPKGDARLSADATPLEGEESQKAADSLARQHPVVHGLVVPRLHRLRGWTTQQYRLDPPSARHSGGSPERA